MSHNSHLGSPPYITAVSPSTFVTTGPQTLTITGRNLSPTCQLDVGSLGTIISGPTYTPAAGGATGDLVYIIDIAAIPDPPTNRLCELVNAGHPSQGALVQTYHGWTPAALTPDGWWDGQTLSNLVAAGTTNPVTGNPWADGDKVSSWTGTGVALTQTIDVDRPLLKLGAINGVAGVTFNSTDFLESTSIENLGDSTLVTVFQSEGPTVSMQAKGGKIGIFKIQSYGGGVWIYLYIGTVVASPVFHPGSLQYDPMAIVFTHNNTTGAAEGFANGVQVMSVNAGTSAGTNTGKIYRYSAPYTLCEFISIPRIITTAERIALDIYLTAKYNL